MLKIGSDFTCNFINDNHLAHCILYYSYRSAHSYDLCTLVLQDSKVETDSSSRGSFSAPVKRQAKSMQWGSGCEVNKSFAFYFGNLNKCWRRQFFSYLVLLQWPHSTGSRRQQLKDDKPSVLSFISFCSLLLPHQCTYTVAHTHTPFHTPLSIPFPIPIPHVSTESPLTVVIIPNVFKSSTFIFFAWLGIGV